MNASRRLASIGVGDDVVAVDATRPAVGRRMPASDRRVVVLPAPFGPISPTISPAADLERQVVHGGERAGSVA